MIDTIKLTLIKPMFYFEKSRFIKDKQEALRGYFKLVQNPTSSELKRGIYKPRLAITNRFTGPTVSQKTLSVEFSIPKLIFGNNFDELKGDEFPQIIEKLNALLLEMGVKVRKSCLINAPVSLVHYSKNIPLTDYSTPYTYIQQLNKVNFSAILDTSQTSYFNGGNGIKAHANSYEIAFYDKLLDLQKAKISPKRAYDKDSLIQLHLFDKFTPQKAFEVLRMEIRLNTRRKIRQILKTTNQQQEPTFSNLFNANISKTVLLYYLKTIENNYPPLLAYQQTPKKLFSGLIIANPNTKLKTLLTMYGLKALIEDIGTKGFRQLTKHYGKPTWYSLNKQMKQLKTADEPSIFNLVHNQLSAFEPLKLLDFQDNLLNNDKYN